MTFKEILESRIEKTRAVLSKKEAEYAEGGNRYHNFDEAAKLLNVSPEEALVGMWVKHVVSIFDMVRTISLENLAPPDSLVDEKIGDAINYLILLEGMIKRRKE